MTGIVHVTRVFFCLGLGSALGAACSGSDSEVLFQPRAAQAGAAGKAGSSPGGSSTGGSSGGDGGAGVGGSAAACVPADCDDGVPCTDDSCKGGACVHVPGKCPTGQTCDVKSGCTNAPACSNDETCKAAWGSDPCKANIRCDGATAFCTFDALDKDGDLHGPAGCGGDDCDDLDPTVHPGHVELCDGKDNGCTGTIDVNTTCASPRECMSGVCGCIAGNECGSTCVDKQSDVNNCGTCGNKCVGAVGCKMGACECPANLALCGATCVDTQTNGSHCGGCGLKCAVGAPCMGGKCACSADKPDICSGTCVSLQTDKTHCGTCTKVCGAGDTCTNGVCGKCVSGGFIIMLDQSASTSLLQTNGETRLKQMQTGVSSGGTGAPQEFVSTGLSLYPRAQATACTATDYATPTLMIAAWISPTQMTAAAQGAATVGNEEFAAPFAASVDNVKAWIAANPTRPGGVVVLSDGAPSGSACSDDAATAIAAAAAAFSGTPSIRTHVIGVGEPTAEDLKFWSDLAAAGGGSMTNVGNGAASTTIRDKLKAIRQSFSCL